MIPRSVLSALLPLLLFFSGTAEGACLSPQQAEMTPEPIVPIPGTPFSAAICWRPEGRDHHFRDRIELLERGRIVARAVTEPHTTERIAGLTLDRREGRFAALYYENFELCNGMVIFDLQRKRVAAQLGCVGESYACELQTLDKKACRAELLCKDHGGDAGDDAPRRADIRKSLKLCQ